MKLSEATYTVIDLETTGGANVFNRIIELSALKVYQGEIVNELTALINPQIPISYFITQYTGITNEMVKHAPPSKVVLPKLLDMMGDSVFVAHNTSFDYTFINLELERNGFQRLGNRTICTVRLARRLLPKNIRKNLGDLSAYLGVTIQNRHRAKGDCEATVGVLHKLIEIAEEKHRIEHLEELISLQYKAMRVFKREPKHIRIIRETVLPKLPEQSGVYFFYSERNELLYIGKSKNLKSRVSSYFVDTEHKADKVKELVMVIRKVEWQATGSELEALLVESKLIKLHKPRYNTLLKRYQSYPFLKLTAHDFPKLEVAMEIANDGAEYFGPFFSMEMVKDVFNILNHSFLLRECSDEELKKGRSCVYLNIKRCVAPCEPMFIQNNEYEIELNRVRRFLSGQDSEIIDLLTEKMKKYAAEQRFEEAAELRERIHNLRRVFYRQSSVTASINENNALILLPSERYSDVCKEFLLLFVRFGRVVFQEKFFLDDALQLLPTLKTVFFDNQIAPKICKKEEINDMQILSSWIYLNRHTLSLLYVRHEHTPESLLNDLIDRLCKLSNDEKINLASETEFAS